MANKTCNRTFLAGLVAALLSSTYAQASCPGYKASKVHQTSTGLTADLSLKGDGCNLYSPDIKDLRLSVQYQSENRLHVKIYDADERVYQVPESVVPRPSGSVSQNASELVFHMVENPFSFSVERQSTGEVLFDTSGSPLIFETQYLSLRTKLPTDPNLYGLGESADSLRLPTSNYSHTFWNQGEPFLPEKANLYGTHNVYYDHREANGTHAVFLLNSNGMKININDSSGQSLEYNTLGGVFDFYFLSGPDPVSTSMQYAEVVGHAALMPYWGFGFHQCRYGMVDVYEVAGVVANYSSADIPLETMWTDIDYMDYRRTLSLDPVRFPLRKMQQLVDHLHSHQQNYIMMVDPAVANYPYRPYQDGVTTESFLRNENGSVFNGVVWAGASAFPDWFNPSTQKYWNSQFADFFSPTDGVDIDGLWIDMNEASNFCNYPCTDPALSGIQMQDPPRPPVARMHSPYAVPGFPSDFQPHCVAYVTFNVQTMVDNSVDQLLIMGNAFGLGESVPHNAPELFPYGTNPPVWNLTVQLPPKMKVIYQYPLYSYSTNGTYTFEAHNRSITTGGCNTMWNPQQVHDVMKTTSNDRTHGEVDVVRTPTEASADQSQFEVRQQPGSDKPGSMKGLPHRDLLNPNYDIDAYFGNISFQGIPTNIYHSNGLVEYDVHNLYGTMMSVTSRNAMISRRPGQRPLIITRSTFAGAGAHVGHWFGDNISTWLDYRTSIRQMIEFAALFQFPMVGSDVCGFNGNTTIHLCSRWATLGAFYPFFRNHKVQGALPQEFYRWPLVAEAARGAISTRYRLLDYLYTAMYNQNVTGTPTISPLFFIYPTDKKTFNNQEQFFFGESIMVSPVLHDNTTSVDAYMPDDIFYDLVTLEPVRGDGSVVQMTDISYTMIPAHIKGGSIIPMRSKSANTTTEVRKQNFSLYVAPGVNGSAAGSLYLDDGISLIQQAVTHLKFSFAKSGEFEMSGVYKYDPGVVIESITLLGVAKEPQGCPAGVTFNATARTLTRSMNASLQKYLKMNLLKC